MRSRDLSCVTVATPAVTALLAACCAVAVGLPSRAYAVGGIEQASGAAIGEWFTTASPVLETSPASSGFSVIEAASYDNTGIPNTTALRPFVNSAKS